MGIRGSFRYSDIEKALKSDLIAIEANIIRIMKRCGNEFVTDAKNGLNISSSAFPKGDYKDQTANLRSSIGYVIMRDNEVIEQNIDGTGQGMSAGLAALRARQSGTGYRLIGVAGMEYASALESKGYNVISSQKETTLINLSDRLKKFSKQLGKKGMNIDFDTNF
ncbi:hypothetical protein LX69_01143 [Breznakibacter xylanolyticus]|uniref:Uncharacterized protein n=1 Tax=Breznakibacter xylanolyticus TaxID=990 RepID=A0A2W7NXV6_9BACT|nr:hypothetical protein [Breznakibacter xylanolyticus]PZX18106.1 hypothetical protein LX69_01143 [Breznakibacter xylanolyticus]